ncbi:D-alanyl-D-alanine carboxypeptidase family protein [[Mycobacterium] wendilense]|uniref:Serine hydrolase n=1 Tax=[Mycobacterium] wendilense TaxID=3064284 RepID=A0ABN9P061_9MYCO|nr:serine hydrolase [Mycolicibacterium sp. MU0050]CAJ1583993.1 serine hydrolase [Mycolicibacterium sp. MU0050]
MLTLIGALCAPPSAAAPDIGPVGAVAAPDGPARAWLIADMDSGAILAGKDPYGSFAPASTIKVLLAMVVLDHLSPAAAVRANANHTKVECSCVGLVPGQVYTTRQLLEGLLMVSGNDAANLLGDMLGGYRAAIARMTAKAQSLGARNTRALSPSGLDGPGWESRTTAHDLAILFRRALAYPLIAHIMRQPTAMFPARSGYKQITNQNKLLQRYPGTLGGKTGYTNLAGDTFVSAAQRDGRRLVVAQLKGSGDLYGQAMRLFDWGFALPR